MFTIINIITILSLFLLGYKYSIGFVYFTRHNKELSQLHYVYRGNCKLTHFHVQSVIILIANKPTAKDRYHIATSMFHILPH